MLVNYFKYFVWIIKSELAKFKLLDKLFEDVVESNVTLKLENI